MPTFDLKIINGHIADEHSTYEADIIIDEGIIKGILKDSSSIKTDETICAKKMLIMPGIIDAHVHFLDPGYPNREDWQSGTESAATGGVTMVLDMPSTSLPVTTTAETFRIKKNIAQKKAVIDFGLHAGINPDNIKEMPKLAREGVASFKMFMCETTSEMREITSTDMVELFQLLSRIRRVGMIHAEDPMVSKMRESFQKRGMKDPETYIKSRPNIAEAMAVFIVTSLGRKFNANLHIAHLSTRESVVILQSNFHSGITAETCPQYLYFTENDAKKLGPYLKVKPPIRTFEDREMLWKGLREGVIASIASDHCPFSKAEKEIGWKNIWEAGTGIPGVETLLPVMLTEGIKRGFSYSDLTRVLCQNPARIFGLDSRKGFIKVGYDADLTLIDLKTEIRISAENTHSKCTFTPYENYKTKGYPVMTIVRGKTVMERGSITSKPGTGKYVPSLPCSP